MTQCVWVTHSHNFFKLTAAFIMSREKPEQRGICCLGKINSQQAKHIPAKEVKWGAIPKMGRCEINEHLGQDEILQ